MEICDKGRLLILRTAKLFDVHDTRGRVLFREYHLSVLEYQARPDNIGLHVCELHFARNPRYGDVIWNKCSS